MKKAILALMAISTIAMSYDSDYPVECDKEFQSAMESKGTKNEQKAFNEFAECTKEIPLCFSLSGAWISYETDFCEAHRPKWVK